MKTSIICIVVLAIFAGFFSRYSKMYNALERNGDARVTQATASLNKDSLQRETDSELLLVKCVQDCAAYENTTEKIVFKRRLAKGTKLSLMNTERIYVQECSDPFAQVRMEHDGLFSGEVLLIAAKNIQPHSLSQTEEIKNRGEKVVFSQSYVGKGWDESDSKKYHIETAPASSVSPGDKVVFVSAGTFKVFESGQWSAHEDRHEIPIAKKMTGYFYVEGSENEEIHVAILRP